MKVWGRRNSMNVQKVMWTLGEIGMPYERVDVGGSFGGTATDEFGQMNPNRRIPVIQDNGLVLWESNVIVRYLTNVHDAEGVVHAGDPQTTAIADQWMEWMQTVLVGDMTVIFGGMIVGVPNPPSQAQMDSSIEKLATLWGIVEAQLDGQDYIAGDKLSIGDIALGPALHRYLNFPIERPSLPNVEAWYARLLDRPAYSQHVGFPFGGSPAEWRALEQAGAGL